MPSLQNIQNLGFMCGRGGGISLYSEAQEMLGRVGAAAS